jgi:hypothetical protein
MISRRKRMVGLGLLILLISSSVTGQTRRDPRGMALGGAYGMLARGPFVVDYNPANLALEDQYKSYRVWFGLNASATNNFLSLKRYLQYNGKDLEAEDRKLKKQLLEEIPANGWRIFTDVHIPIPYLNFSRYNKAFTSDIIAIGDIGLPEGLVKFIFDGNPIRERLDMDFHEEFLLMNQFAYSFAFPVKGLLTGISLKYLQGINYFGINPDSSYGYITTHFSAGRNYMDGEGYYLFQQSIGGRGFALDIGISTQEINGYRLGLSISNLFGRIVWNKNTLVSRLIDEDGFIGDGGNRIYWFEVNEARMDKLFGKSTFNDLFPGGNRATDDSSEFVMRYPALVRFSLSKWLDDNVQLATDFVVGFEDRFYSFGAWKWSTGIEFTNNPRVPIRAGVSFGGWKQLELTFGSGYRLGFIHFNWALGLNQGLWFSTARGINLAFNIFTTKKDKNYNRK